MSVQPDPVPLAAVVGDLLTYSDLMDASLRLRLHAYQAGYKDGRERGWTEGYTAAVNEQYTFVARCRGPGIHQWRADAPPLGTWRP